MMTKEHAKSVFDYYSKIYGVGVRSGRRSNELVEALSVLGIQDPWRKKEKPSPMFLLMRDYLSKNPNKTFMQALVACVPDHIQKRFEFVDKNTLLFHFNCSEPIQIMLKVLK